MRVLSIGRHLALLNRLAVKLSKKEDRLYSLKQKIKKAKARDSYNQDATVYGLVYNSLLRRLPAGCIIVQDELIKNKNKYNTRRYTNKIVFV